MFTELRIRNFRLFEDLTIKGLRRINLFVGKNNSGKSAAVEAVVLLAVPYGPFQMNLTRSMKVPPDEYAFDSYLRSFFRDLDASEEIEITAKHSEFGIRKCMAAVVQAPDASVLADRPPTESIGKLPSQAALKVRLEEHDRYLQYQTLLDNERERLALAEQKESTPPPRSFSLEYVPTNLDLGKPVIDRLSELRKEKRTQFILDVLRQIEPRLADVPEVLMDHDVPNLFCDIGIGKLVPLGLMGQGLARVLRLVLMIESGSQGDITVIDEIENGLHHESLFDVWRALSETAHRYDKQVFATTHSYECIRSASDAIDRNDLAIHRLEVDDDRTTRCVTLDPEAIEGAIANGFEIR